MEAVANIVVVSSRPERTTKEPVQRALATLRAAHLEIMRVYTRGTEVRGELGRVLQAITMVLDLLPTDEGLRVETRIDIEPRPPPPPFAAEAPEGFVEPELLLEW